MKVFMENPGKALSREEILDMVFKIAQHIARIFSP